jgi:hypothetical protein
MYIATSLVSEFPLIRAPITIAMQCDVITELQAVCWRFAISLGMTFGNPIPVVEQSLTH